MSMCSLWGSASDMCRCDENNPSQKHCKIHQFFEHPPDADNFFSHRRKRVVALSQAVQSTALLTKSSGKITAVEVLKSRLINFARKVQMLIRLSAGALASLFAVLTWFLIWWRTSCHQPHGRMWAQNLCQVSHHLLHHLTHQTLCCRGPRLRSPPPYCG